jgi:ethanolamine utilization protein EutM
MAKRTPQKPLPRHKDGAPKTPVAQSVPDKPDARPESASTGQVRRALGIVETMGLVGAIEACDAMVKRAEVAPTARIKVDGGLVTVTVRGDVGSVQEAVEAGARAARNLGALIGVHVIPLPHDELEPKLPER